MKPNLGSAAGKLYSSKQHFVACMGILSALQRQRAYCCFEEGSTSQQRRARAYGAG